MKLEFNDKVYDVLKWLCLICLPAASALYAALDKTFGWGYAETVTVVIAAVQTFIGTLIGVSTAAYREKEAEADAEQQKSC